MDRGALEKMLEQGQDNVLLRYSLGSLSLKEKQYETAAEHLQQAVRLDQSHSASWKLYGKALAQLGRTDEAREVYSKGIEVAESKGDVQAVKEMRVFLKRLN
jgi:uncharacterized protein HemY